MPSRTTPTTTKRLSPLGLVLRGIRDEARMTQQEHAKAIGIGRAYLSRMESGERRASHERLLEILGVLPIDRQAEIQARLAIFHGDGILSEGELAVLMVYHGCRPVICLYKSHETYGDRLEACDKCGQRLMCRPEGHQCPNGCEVEGAVRPPCGGPAGGPSGHGTTRDWQGEADA